MVAKAVPKRAKRWFYITDTHGDKADYPALSVALDFCRNHWKPDIRIHGGDVFDFRWLRKKAGEEEKRERIEDDIYAGLDLLRTYQPTHVLWGNHDDRLMSIPEESTHGPTLALAAATIEKIQNALGAARTYDYCKRFGVCTKVGRFAIMHGLFTGIYAAKQHAETYGNCIFGHCHVNLMHTVHRWPAPVVGYGVGCLCQLDLGYNKRSPRTLRQGHGFAYGHILPSGDATIYMAEKIGAQWYMPTECIEMKEQPNAKCI